MATTNADEPMPVLSRIEKLDLMMSYFEEIKGSNKVMMRNSSCASTSSSGTVAMTNNSDGGNSSVNSSPKSTMEKRCKPMADVVMQTRVKGSLIERVHQLEARLLKLEEYIENEKKRETEGRNSPRSTVDSKKHKKGLKTLVKSCMRGKLKTKE